MSKSKTNASNSSELMVNNRPKRGEADSLEEELLKEKLKVSKDTGKIVDVVESSRESENDW